MTKHHKGRPPKHGTRAHWKWKEAQKGGTAESRFQDSFYAHYPEFRRPSREMTVAEFEASRTPHREEPASPVAVFFLLAIFIVAVGIVCWRVS